MKEWDKPLMDRKPKPVEKDEFDRLQKTLRAERYVAFLIRNKRFLGGLAIAEMRELPNERDAQGYHGSLDRARSPNTKSKVERMRPAL